MRMARRKAARHLTSSEEINIQETRREESKPWTNQSRACQRTNSVSFKMKHLFRKVEYGKLRTTSFVEAKEFLYLTADLLQVGSFSDIPLPAELVHPEEASDKFW